MGRCWHAEGRSAPPILEWLKSRVSAFCVLVATDFVMLQYDVTLLESRAPDVH